MVRRRFFVALGFYSGDVVRLAALIVGGNGHFQVERGHETVEQPVELFRLLEVRGMRGTRDHLKLAGRHQLVHGFDNVHRKYLVIRPHNQ